MMKKTIFALLVGVCAFLSGCEQGGSVDGKVSAARARNDGPPMWVVKDDDSTLYLYGTVHLLPSDLDWQRDDMKDAFREAGTIFFELDTGEAAQLQATMLTQQLGFLPSGVRLSERLDSYQLKLFEAAANNGNISIDTLNSMKPWLASEFLVIAAAANQDLSPDLAADQALKTRARQQKKNVVYLDTTERQIRASADQPESVQMMLLGETLEGFNAMGQDLRRTANAWSVGNTEILADKTVKTIKSRSPELYARLYTERNADWAEQFDAFLKGSGTGLAAIGVSHLLGDENVQNALRRKGYAVTRYYAFQGPAVIKTIDIDK